MSSPLYFPSRAGKGTGLCLSRADSRSCIPPRFPHSRDARAPYFRTRSFRHRFAIHSPELNCHNRTFHVKHFTEFPASQIRFSDHHLKFDTNFTRRLRHRSTPCYRKHRARFVRASADAAVGEDVSRETFPPDQRANTCLLRRSRRDIAATMQVIASISTTTNCYRRSENVSRETFPPKSATEQRQNLELGLQ